MPISLIDIAKPKNNQLFPIAEDIDILGGFRVVATDAARDAIGSKLKKHGMWVFVAATQLVWSWNAGTVSWDLALDLPGLSDLLAGGVTPGGGTITSQVYGLATCVASDSVGDLVCITGAKQGQRWQVTVSDITLADPLPALGLLVNKLSATQAIVQTAGEVDLSPLGIADLVSGKRCFVFYDGWLSSEDPSAYASPSGIAMVQVVGLATGPSTVMLAPSYAVAMVDTAGKPSIPGALLRRTPGLAPPGGVGGAGGGTGGTTVADVTSLVSASPYLCPSSVQVGDLVYLASGDTVDRAQANSEATMPCIGVVKSKPTTTQAVVQFAGEVPGFLGLLPDTTYYVSTDAPGQMQDAPPVPGAGPVVLQKIGSARSATTLILTVNPTDYVVM